MVEPLLAVDDWFRVDRRWTFTILDVLSNDLRNARYIGDDPILTIQGYRTDGEGQISIDDDRVQLIYTPAAGFQGVETIVYTAVDQDGYTVEGTAQVRVDNDQSAIHFGRNNYSSNLFSKPLCITNTLSAARLTKVTIGMIGPTSWFRWRYRLPDPVPAVSGP